MATLNLGLGVSLQLTLDPGLGFGANKFTATADAPAPPTYGNASGQLQGVVACKGTLTAGATNIDLTAITVGTGNCIYTNVGSLAKVCAILIYNDNYTDGNNLTYDGTVTNALTGPMATITTAKITILPGAAISGVNYSGFYLIGGFNTSGFTVDATHKVISLNSGAATINYRMLILGR